MKDNEFSFSQFLQSLAVLVGIDSGTDNPEGVNQVLTYLQKRYHEIGWKTCRQHLSNQCGNLLIACNRRQEWYDYLLLGHMDTVFPKGTAAKRPFSIQADGITAMGPGVADMKHGLLVMLTLAEMLGTNGHASVMCVMTPDEEIGSPYSSKLVRQLTAHAKQVLIFEAASPDGSHCVTRKGCTRCEIMFHGIPAHAGYLFETKHASAISELCRFVPKLERLCDRDRDITCSVGLITGGSAINVVAETASLKAELRMWHKEEQAALREKIMELIAYPEIPGCHIELSSCTETPPLQPTAHTMLAVKKLQTIATQYGDTFEVKPRCGISDANLLQGVCPVILDALAPIGGSDHCPQEFMRTDTIERCIHLLYTYLSRPYT